MIATLAVRENPPGCNGCGTRPLSILMIVAQARQPSQVASATMALCRECEKELKRALGAKVGVAANTARELETLMASPTISATVDAWAAAFGRERSLVAARAVKKALAAGYSFANLVEVIRVLKKCLDEGGAPSGSLIAWMIDHSKRDASYVFRPSTLEKLLVEVDDFSFHERKGR